MLKLTASVPAASPLAKVTVGLALSGLLLLLLPSVLLPQKAAHDAADGAEAEHVVATTVCCGGHVTAAGH